MSHMYSKKKIREICNLMDARWKTEDKITQYKGLLAIFARENKKEIHEANKVRRQQAMQLEELRKDNSHFRKTLGESMYGNKQRLRNALQPNRLIQLCYQRLWPSKSLEFFEHAINNKRKELDLLKYRKSKRMEVFTNLRFEKAELQDRLGVGFENIKFRRSVQMLTNRIEMFVVRQNAAAQVYKLYKNMINLLQSDSHYFDAILVVIHSLTEEQCRCILQAAELGQLTHEDLVDIRDQYKSLEKEVKINMKERKREVTQIKKVAEELVLKCQLLTQAESYGYVYRASDSSIFGEGNMEIEIKELEMLMKKVQEATLSPTYFDVFPRMLEQLRQEETLIKNMKKMSQARDRVLHMKHHSEMLLSSLSHTETASTLKFNEKKAELEDELNEERFRLSHEKETIEDFGKMLAALKIALQALYETVHRLKELPIEETLDVGSDIEIEVSLTQMTPKEIEQTFPPPIPLNPKILLGKIFDGLTLFHIYASESLDEEILQEATVSHQHQVLLGRSDVGPVLEADVPLLDEVVADDAGVLSREQLKLKSKQMVEEHQRLVLLAEMGPAAAAKLRRRF